MIFDGEKPSYAEVIKSAESTISIHCKHDELFWEQASTMDFGDVCLCQRCNQYFTKIKTMPRVVREHSGWCDSSVGKLMVRIKPSQQHWNKICIVRVPVRVLDEKENNKES